MSLIFLLRGTGFSLVLFYINPIVPYASAFFAHFLLMSTAPFVLSYVNWITGSFTAPLTRINHRECSIKSTPQNINLQYNDVVVRFDSRGYSYKK